MKEDDVIVLKQGQIVAFVPVTERERRVMNVEPQGIKQLPAMVVSAVAGELVMAVFTNDVHKPVMRRYNVPHESAVAREDDVPMGDYWKEAKVGEAVDEGMEGNLMKRVIQLELSNAELSNVIAETVKTNKEKLEALQASIVDAGKVKTLQDELAALKKAVSALEKSGKRNTMTPPPPEEQKETPPAAGDGDKK